MKLSKTHLRHTLSKIYVECKHIDRPWHFYKRVSDKTTQEQKKSNHRASTEQPKSNRFMIYKEYTRYIKIPWSDISCASEVGSTLKYDENLPGLSRGGFLMRPDSYASLYWSRKDVHCRSGESSRPCFHPFLTCVKVIAWSRALSRSLASPYVVCWHPLLGKSGNSIDAAFEKYSKLITS